MGKKKNSVYRSALQISPETIKLLDDARLKDLMDALLKSQAYRCGANVAEIRVNSQVKAQDEGCDAWSPQPPSRDLWLGEAETCWQFKAGKAGQPAELKVELVQI